MSCPSSMPQWFQKLAAGLLDTPQAIMQAVRSEEPKPDQRFFGAPDDEDARNAPLRLKFPTHFYSPGHLRQIDRADWQGVDPRIALFSAALTRRLKGMGIPVYIHTAYRTKADQDAAQARGNSNLSGDRAPHRVGGAVDIVHGVFHWEMNRPEWAFIGKIGKDLHERMMQSVPKSDRYQITWGGDWLKLWDPAHWELADWQSLPNYAEKEPLRLTPKNILDQYAPK